MEETKQDKEEESKRVKKGERSQRSCSKSLRKIGKVEFTLGSLTLQACSWTLALDPWS